MPRSLNYLIKLKLKTKKQLSKALGAIVESLIKILKLTFPTNLIPNALVTSGYCYKIFMIIMTYYGTLRIAWPGSNLFYYYVKRASLTRPLTRPISPGIFTSQN